MDEVKVWRCAGGHVLGVVRRNGSRIRQLLLYRAAVDEAAARRGEVEVMAVVEGYVADVRCSICGCVRTWVPGRDELRRLLKGLGVEVTDDFLDASPR